MKEEFQNWRTQLSLQPSLFSLAVLIGLYSYSIFLLGALRLLTQANILLVSILFALICLKHFTKIIELKIHKLGKLSKIFLLLIIIQLLVNLIGALGPEIGFDALWYHLTLPKIWLQRHAMIFIPGSQFKYSVMPMLTEMFYFIFPGKIIHYIFGILTLAVTFKLSRKLLDIKYSTLSILILSSNLVFGWEQTSAYIDLSRTFFEVMALYMFSQNKIYKSALMLGLAVSTKLLAIASLPIFLTLLILSRYKLKQIFIYTSIVLLTICPWLIRAYLSTGNPIYPFFTNLYTESKISLNPQNLLNLLIHAADPISPIYILILPLVLFVSKKNFIFFYSFLAIIIWVLTPNSGGGRFILPYLPALSITAAIVIQTLKSKNLILIAILISLFSITYRLAANLKYLQPEEQLLTQHLNFDFGDYYDFDHFFKPSDHVLPIGINNLYYLTAYIADPNENFEYILLRDNPLPLQYQNWKLVSQNAITNTSVYERPD